jgi:hypothetical protein
MPEQQPAAVKTAAQHGDRAGEIDRKYGCVKDDDAIGEHFRDCGLHAIIIGQMYRFDGF